MMSKKVASFRPASCQQLETVQVRICSVVQLWGSLASAAGVMMVAGDFDYFLKIRVGDMADFNRIHGEKLIALPGVRQTRTFFVMKEVVDNAPMDF